MKKTFPGYFPPTKTQADRLWETCHFAVDTNILLNLYRYSDATRNEFIGVLKAIKDRLWLPHRVAQEYFGNRLQVISQQERAYEEAVKTIQTLQADLSNARQHPFLSDKLMNKLTQVLAEVVQELESAKATHAKRTSSDEIQEAIGDLFNGRVGPPYPDGQLETIWKEGEDRYARKVPPGYMDDGKDEGTSSGTHNHRKYGDLVVWRQIIDRATEARKGIIFVNDDKKEDWWLIFRGKMLGPRPELISEFLAKTGQGFFMYQADRFLGYAAEHLKQEITPESMHEIRDLRKRDRDWNAKELSRVEEELRLREDEMRLGAKVEEALKRLESARSLMTYLRDKTSQLQHGEAVYQEKLHRSGGEDRESIERLLELKDTAASIEREMARVYEEISVTEREYAMAQDMLAKLRRITAQRFAHGHVPL